ncbi:hypothetical protein [Streptomyces geranii]|nr:hypothetical protein [Streptomyces geranii]
MTLVRSSSVIELTDGSLLTCDEPNVTFDDEEDASDPRDPAGASADP